MQSKIGTHNLAVAVVPSRPIRRIRRGEADREGSSHERRADPCRIGGQRGPAKAGTSQRETEHSAHRAGLIIGPWKNDGVPDHTRPHRVMLSHKLTIHEVHGPVSSTFETDRTESAVDDRHTAAFEQVDVEGLSQAVAEAVAVSLRISFSVAEWIDCLGGYVGEVTDPDDPALVYPLSLEEWRSRDPDRTWLRIVAVVRYRLRGLGHTGRPRRGRPRLKPATVHSVRVLRPG
jgi:hypothetical protein